MLTIVLCCLLKTYHFASRVTHSCHRVAASTFDQNLSDFVFPRQKFDGGDSEPVLFFGSEIKPTNPVNPLFSFVHPSRRKSRKSWELGRILWHLCATPGDNSHNGINYHDDNNLDPINYDNNNFISLNHNR